jgi:hypothetical protein
MLALLVVCGMTNAATANTCLLIDQLQLAEWEPEAGSVFPKSICIFPDGRSGLSDAAENVVMLFGALFAPYGGVFGCEYQFLGKSIDFGYSGSGVALCGGGAVFTPCESLPCSFNWYGIAGGGHSPVDAQGQPQGMAEVIWVPDTCEHGCSQKYFALYVNSPDINGDLVVDLSDIALFSSDLNGTYNYRSDFNYDGNVNLSDIGVLSAGMGATCSAR